MTKYNEMSKAELVDAAVVAGLFPTKTAARKTPKAQIVAKLVDAVAVEVAQPVEVVAQRRAVSGKALNLKNRRAAVYAMWPEVSDRINLMGLDLRRTADLEEAEQICLDVERPSILRLVESA